MRDHEGVVSAGIASLREAARTLAFLGTGPYLLETARRLDHPDPPARRDPEELP